MSSYQQSLDIALKKYAHSLLNLDRWYHQKYVDTNVNPFKNEPDGTYPFLSFYMSRTFASETLLSEINGLKKLYDNHVEDITILHQIEWNKNDDIKWIKENMAMISDKLNMIMIYIDEKDGKEENKK